MVAKGEVEPKDIVIYYLHEPERIPNGEQQVKRINILKDGRLSKEYGPGFFDESSRFISEMLGIRGQN